MPRLYMYLVFLILLISTAALADQPHISVAQPYTGSKSTSVFIQFTIPHGISSDDQFIFLGALTSNVGEVYDIERLTLQFRVKQNNDSYELLTHLLDVDVNDNTATFNVGQILDSLQPPLIEISMMASIKFRSFPKEGFDEARFIYRPENQENYPQFITFPLDVRTTFSPKVYFDGIYQDKDPLLSDIVLITDPITLPPSHEMIGITMQLGGYATFKAIQENEDDSPFCLLNNVFMNVHLADNHQQIRLAFIDSEQSFPQGIALSLRCSKIKIQQSDLKDPQPVEGDFISITMLSTQVVRYDNGALLMDSIDSITNKKTINYAMSRKIFYVQDTSPWMDSLAMIEDDFVNVTYKITGLLQNPPKRSFKLTSQGIDMGGGIARVFICDVGSEPNEITLFSTTLFDQPQDPKDQGRHYPDIPFHNIPPLKSKVVVVQFMISRAKIDPTHPLSLQYDEEYDNDHSHDLIDTSKAQFRLDLLQPNPQDEFFIYTDIALNKVFPPFGDATFDVKEVKGQDELSFTLTIGSTPEMNLIVLSLISGDYKFKGNAKSCHFVNDKKVSPSFTMLFDTALAFTNIYTKDKTEIQIECPDLFLVNSIEEPLKENVPCQFASSLRSGDSISSTKFFTVQPYTRRDNSIKGLTLMVIIVSTAGMIGVCVLAYFVFLCIRRRTAVREMEVSLLDHQDSIIVN